MVKKSTPRPKAVDVCACPAMVEGEDTHDPQATLGKIDPYSCGSDTPRISATFENDIPSVTINGVSLTLFCEAEFAGSLRLVSYKMNGSDVPISGNEFSYDEEEKLYLLRKRINPNIQLTDDEIEVETRICHTEGGVVEGVLEIDLHYLF